MIPSIILGKFTFVSPFLVWIVFVSPRFCKFCAVQKEERLALSFLRLGDAFLAYKIHTWLRHCHVLYDVSTTLPSTAPLTPSLLSTQAPFQFIKLRACPCTSFAVCPGHKK